MAHLSTSPARPRRSFPILLAGAAVAMASAVQAQPQAPAGATSAPPMIMKQHLLADKAMGDMPSHTILAPAGWTVEGGAWWAGGNFFKILPSQDIKVRSPDGLMVHVGPSLGAVDFLPSPYAMQQLGSRRPAEGAADNGNPVLHMPTNLQEWGTFIRSKAIEATYPQATNIRVEQVTIVPELTQLLQRQLDPIRQQQAQANQQAQAFGGGTHSFVDGAVLGASFSYDVDGQRWEQLFLFGTMYTGLDSQIGRQLWWSIEPNVAFRAPAGRLEANLPLLMSIANSVRPTQQWAQMKLDHTIKMNQIAAKGAADRSRIIADSNREISQIIHEGWKNRQASQDRTHERVIKTIREVEDYTVPGSQTKVQLPSHYNHVFSNGNGEYLLTNDALYNPNTDPNVNSNTWNTMEVAPTR